MNHSPRGALHSVRGNASDLDRGVAKTRSNNCRHCPVSGAILLRRAQRGPARAHVRGIHHCQVFEIGTRDVGDANKQRHKYEDGNDCKLYSSLPLVRGAELPEPKTVASHG